MTDAAFAATDGFAIAQAMPPMTADQFVFWLRGLMHQGPTLDATAQATIFGALQKVHVAQPGRAQCRCGGAGH